jgi:hypothetical protein
VANVVIVVDVVVVTSTIEDEDEGLRVVMVILDNTDCGGAVVSGVVDGATSALF